MNGFRKLRWIACMNLVGMMSVLLLLLSIGGKAEAKDRENQDVCIVSVAVDVSGSMKKTDVNRDVVEIMKLMMDICDENDYFSLIAYNDDIVYQSGLVSTGDAKALKKAKKGIDGLVYEGDTDNGLGMLTATKMITDSGVDYDRAMVILISDGATDLPHSPLNRQREDSDADIQTSTDLAKENNITLNIVEYTKTYTDDTPLFSVAVAATGGTVSVVNEPIQFAQVVLNMFFHCFCEGDVNFELREKMDTSGEEELIYDLENYAEEYFFLFAQNPIVDSEVKGDNPGQIITEDRYVIVHANKDQLENSKLSYELEDSCNVLTGVARVKFPEEQEVITEVVEVQVERESKMPVGTDKAMETYSSREKMKFEVSEMFEDDDIVSYTFADEKSALNTELLGNVILVDISKEGVKDITILATDAVGQTATATLHVDVTASWKKYTVLIVAGIVLLILLFALIICIIIIRIVIFGKKKTNQPYIHGYLTARFVDIKTKNNFGDVEWNLSQYPPEGVSLQELFQSQGINEDLYGTDKVCFYPGKMNNELILVHCIEGGVFLGNRNVKANTPTVIRHGATMYVSLAENASEIELTYSGIM